MVIPEWRHISMRLTDHIPTIESLVGGTAAFLGALRYDKVRGAAHCVWRVATSRGPSRVPARGRRRLCALPRTAPLLPHA